VRSDHSEFLEKVGVRKHAVWAADMANFGSAVGGCYDLRAVPRWCQNSTPAGSVITRLRELWTRKSEYDYR